MLPRDSVMLLSYVNTQLRDQGRQFWTRSATARMTDEQALCAALHEIGYEYDAAAESLCVTPVCVKFERGS
ncbi:DUF4250 domain-containing protein [Gemmiger formicilis]|uniref:DUF4250 domain-containing protein n=1 Tax=Gemmiger formicilis TaxID=745368 RepID=UPI0039928D08